MKRKGGRANADRIVAKERRAKAFELRKAGATFKQIGDLLGISAQRAHEIVTEEFTAIADQLAIDVEQVRNMEIERLDAIFMGVWQKARSGDHKAIASALRVMDRRAKLLGLDAPTKLAPTDPSGERPYGEASDAELLAMARNLIESADNGG